METILIVLAVLFLIWLFIYTRYDVGVPDESRSRDRYQVAEDIDIEIDNLKNK